MKKLLFTLCFMCSLALLAAKVEYKLTIGEKQMALGGKPMRSLTVNGGVPAPVLRFRKGDEAIITVHNTLNEDSSIHWHGLLLPNKEDGVPYLTTPPIKPGKSHTFRFKLKHSGTYWYHSHSGLQEQQGVYGAIVVEETDKSLEPRYDREHVLVLSDWTNENPNEVMRTLMRGSHWYAQKKGNAQSLFGVWQSGTWSDWFDNQWRRMPAMDISDVAYDAFLANGQQEHFHAAKPGEVIRLRVINSAASSFFYLDWAGGDIEIIAADGSLVKPVKVKRLLMGMAETYDILLRIPNKAGRWQLRATAQDGSGFSSTELGQVHAPLQQAAIPPKPNLYSNDEMLFGALFDEGNANGERPMSPYKLLQSPTKSSFDKKFSRRNIKLRLTGDMRRYIWSFNGKTLAEESTIRIKRGEVIRLHFINDTMMHHPLHLHGHFFRVIDGDNDENAPWKHTIDVPPMAKRTIEFLADEYGDWFFHCHLLYHMDAGMARVFSYDDQGEKHKPSLDPKLLHPWFFMVDGMLMTQMSRGRAMLMYGKNDFMLRWDEMYEDQKLKNHMYERDLLYSRYIDQNLSIHAGWRWTNEHMREDRALLGLKYRLPLLINSQLEVDSKGEWRMQLTKEVMLTQRLSFEAEVEYDSVDHFNWESGFNYTLNKNLDLTIGYHSETGSADIGLMFRF